ncbi:complement component 1 Q subcomponent-binding protein, mitochondrial-like [Dendronephthya gigantea]|uniref:complement component 1 Q subcomponent-binding protein, mitochondrial-like n=1 Tax=Dendronephthya gigantea TaxID=151771 RepID=UPI00106A6AB5|nr:complement component 1 Q subcomponent-binding protein, mitochondrial-like [Dendronephthya gigantea]XP_028400393.1 complement component 1 Q subcomponent-binding protein, mitochondrial-like [Dendronephthya gigantea]XP_028400394.1 complement component 1 Q subcomponent-binding protein, mitochondrial-like [Dendronephthya gigantea]
MASFKVFNRLIPRKNFCSIFRKNISTVKRSILYVGNTAPSFQNRAGLLASTSLSFSRVCGCGMHNHISEGDQQLLAFLKEELNYENETMKNLEKPKLEIFNQPDDLKNMRFKLTHLINGERIVVSFDVDQTINHETFDDDEGTNDGQMTSYPSFSIQIIKDSGETLLFNCEYNIDDDSSSDSSGEEDNELFTITNVSLLPHPDADQTGIYHCETENMDYNLYELLIGMLTERGINNEFLVDLLRKSTILEHQQYIQFLEGLQDFLSQK